MLPALCDRKLPNTISEGKRQVERERTESRQDVRGAAYRGFQGRVGRTFAGSQGWWPPEPTPPADAPNVIVVLCDDLGYSDLGAFGGEIDTPHLDRLAREGLSYTNFHVTPMCSPTRAALLTGCNPHSVGIGTVAHADPGFPGYAMELADDAATMAEVFADNGYATLMVGKWHLTKDSHCSAAGPQRSWPCQRGFDRFYGILDGFTNMHQPHRLVADNHLVDVDEYPDGYYFTDDITDHAISMIRERKASNPRQPFFLYLSHGAVHAPLQAKKSDIAKYVDRYRDGWDHIRQQRFERQQALGIVAPETELPARNHEPGHDVPAWDDLEPDQQELYARYMAIYAAMVDNVDQNFGRLRSELEAMDVWENTVVIVTSDNGASREGQQLGTSSYFRVLNPLQPVDWRHDFARLDKLGGPEALAHYPMGWAMACNTPYRMYKVNTHQGGHSVPLLLQWPGRSDQVAGELRRQYVYVSDVLPTLVAEIGLVLPEQRQGRPLRSFQGVSFADTIPDASAPSHHVEQYSEMIGHRGMYRDGWEAVTLHQPLTPFGDHEWELYDLRTDPTEINNRAGERPDKVAELASAWEDAAWDNQVYPLDDGSGFKYMSKPPTEAVFSEPVFIRPLTPTLERYRSLQLIFSRSFVVDVSFASGASGVQDQGMLVAHGDQGGGYCCYIENGRLFYAHNAYGDMTVVDAGELVDGHHRLGLDFDAPGGLVWNLVITLDGQQVATASELTMLYPIAPFQGIDVGIDRRSPVSWHVFERYGAFGYTGVIEGVWYRPGEPSPDSPAGLLDVLQRMGRAFE